MASRTPAALAGLLLLALAAHFVSCARPADPFVTPPALERSHSIVADGDTLQPLRVQVHRDTLWVSYRGVSRLDAYDLDLVRLGSVSLTDPEPVQPSAFAVTDSALFVTDHAKGMVVMYDRAGRYLESFGKFPDGETPLLPLSAVHFGGVLYVADVSMHRVLAVSVTDAAGITELGELILTIPAAGQEPLGVLTAVHVTPDGRMFVGDGEAEAVRVFTCDGRPVYSFDPLPEAAGLDVRGFAMDGVRDPSLHDESSFDPSGVRAQGRYHVVDGRGRSIHMFNPMGVYVATYGTGGELDRPTDIAAARSIGRIFVTDPAIGRIHVYQTTGG